MTIYMITIAETGEQHFVDAEDSDKAIDELKESLGIEEISGDVQEVLV